MMNFSSARKGVMSWLWVLPLPLLALGVLCGAGPFGAPGHFSTKAQVSKESQQCIQCHSSLHPNLIFSWERGGHAQNKIGCYECHVATATEPDAIASHFGFVISPVVTPNDCGRCHQVEKASFLKSHHSRAGRILHSKENFWGEIVEGYAAALNGCQACHGSKVEIDPKTGRPDANGFPNSGIGRLNPDGSEGNCTSCHQRHDFRMDTARKSEVCGRCHMGPDHPQIEIYHGSRHGQAFAETNKDVDLNKRKLVLGMDKLGAPSCSTCHLGATTSPEARITHDPGERISWDLRSEVSKRKENWQEKRLAMKSVCRQCHADGQVDRHYVQFDKVVALYNHKFALPATDIMKTLREQGKLDPSPFNEPIEITFYHLWHHEGRRARHGAAMMGADYVQWEGFFEVAKRFYFELIPEAERLSPGISTEILNRPEHQWFRDKISKPEDLMRAIKNSREFWHTQSPDPTTP
jgi:hypothetical protein